MKNFILIIAVLVVSACASMPTVKSVAGTYTTMEDTTVRMVLLENGVVEAYADGKKHDVDGKWTLKNGEVVLTGQMVTTTETDGKTKVVKEGVGQIFLTIKSNGDLVSRLPEDAPHIPNAVNVNREVITFKKIK